MLLPRQSTLDGWLRRYEVSPDGCWLWQGSLNPGGYGHAAFSLNGQRRDVYLHRVFYYVLVGEIPAGHDLDHLCRVRHCVNPDHLEPVTRAVNLRRGIGVGGLRSAGVVAENAAKTHCKHGHPFDEANTYWVKTGGRACRACDRETHRARSAAAREAA